MNLSAEQPEGEEIGPAFQAAGGVIVSVLKAHPSTQKNRLLSLRLPRAICPTGDSHLAHSGIRMLPPTRVAIVGLPGFERAVPGRSDPIVGRPHALVAIRQSVGAAHDLAGVGRV